MEDLKKRVDILEHIVNRLVEKLEKSMKIPDMICPDMICQAIKKTEIIKTEENIDLTKLFE